MKKLNYLTIFLLLLLISSCQPDEPPPIVEDIDRRTQFVGTYRVNNVSEPYTFTISKLDTLEQTWVRVNNFANMFDIKFKMNQNENPKNEITFPSYFPIIDTKFNHKWSFAVYGNDTIRSNSLLVNDTLRIYFRVHNTPWYGEDDTTYTDKYELHIGVKQ
jgi:hypothetical protein